MYFVKFTHNKEDVFINPFLVSGIMSCDTGRILQGSIDGGTDICMFGEAHISVDQYVKEAKDRLENGMYYNITVIADAIKTSIIDIKKESD